MASYLYNPATKLKLEKYLESPSQALLLIKQASESSLIYEELASRLLAAKLAPHQNYIVINRQLKSQNISIDDVRALKHSTRLKTTSRNKINKVIVIDNAADMNTEAQTALLKSLEEPVNGTVYILSTESSQSLLPTIVSRCSIIKLLPISLDSALNHYKDQYDEQSIIAAWHLSNGDGEQLVAILRNPNNSQRAAVDSAKSILKMKNYDRLLAIDKISTNKDDFRQLLTSLLKLLKAVYGQSLKAGSQATGQKYLNAAKLVSSCLAALDQNGSAKLISTHLALNLRV